MYNSYRSSSSSHYKHQYQERESRNLISSQMTQERQIQDLQQKVDMILIHNNKLIEENTQLRKLIDSKASRSSSIETLELHNTLNRLTKQLQLKDHQTSELRIALHQQIDTLTKQLMSIKSNRNLLLKENQQLKQSLENYEQYKNKQIDALTMQIKNQMYENALQKQTQYRQELSQSHQSHKNQIKDLKDKHAKQLSKLEQDNMEKILKIQEKFKKQNQQNRKHLQEQFQRRFKEMQRNTNERCREIRDKSQKYIKSVLQAKKGDQEDLEDVLKKQIEALKGSLKSRQLLIQSLLQSTRLKSDGDYDRYYKEAQELRKRIKQITENFFKQSELLKVKMAIKHQADVKEVGKAYQTRLDILGQKLNYLEYENQRLRKNYEEQIRGKMNLRHKFELEGSKMKTIIRKLKIELQSYGKELRLNIQGIKDQANSFSMSIIGQLGQEKSKKVFHDQQIRKMQQIIQLKQSQIQTTINQCNQKVKYYHQKLQITTNKLKQAQQQNIQQQQEFNRDLESQKQEYRQENQKQKQHYQRQIKIIEKQLLKIKQGNETLEEKIIQLKSDKSVLEKQINDKQHEIQSIKAHLEAVKLEMEMMGFDFDADTVVAPLKKHYERIIEEIEKDKQNLQETNSLQAEQIAKLVAKYKNLENSMEKTLSTLQKRKVLDEKVINLGMDTNLVKNLAEIFRRNEE